jgi:general nucleoside transport system permease protein
VADLFATFLLTSNYWDSVVRVSGPVLLAALGAVLCSRAGILYVGVEGVLLISTFFAIGGTIWTGSVWLGVLIAALGGAASSLFLGVLSMSLRMGDVIGGLVIDIGALGVTGFLRDKLFTSGATIGGKQLDAFWPSFGGKVVDVFLHQQPLIYVGFAAAFVMAAYLRTSGGLRLRASGESIQVAQSFGIGLVRLRFAVLAVSGLLTGLGGAVLGLAISGTFDVNVVGGKGFIALACVILGAWRPVGVVLASLAFGAVYALQFQLDIGGIGEWIQIFPYAVTLLAIAAFWGRAQGPAEEGRGIPED